MNRSDFQRIADDRVSDAKALLDAGRWSGAYYLCGYAVECALKACIAKQTKEHDFPDKGVVERAYTHDLDRLLKAAGLSLDPAQRPLAQNWSVVKDWSERVRYEDRTEAEARRLFQAVDDPQDGVLPWIKKFW